MPRLKNPQIQIPNGFQFKIPGIPQWQPPKYASINIIAQSAITVLKGNPHVAKNLGWDLSEPSIISRIDQHNACICKAAGWSDYYIEDSGLGGAAVADPFTPTPPSLEAKPPLLQRLGNVVAGSSVIVQTLASRDEAVPADKSSARADVCCSCPVHEKGDWLSFFTIPAADAIRKAVNAFGDLKLSTPRDSDLGICGACDCVLRLKVHFPVERIVNGLSAAQKTRLWEKCWIRAESNQ